jgi:hypothetical protein
MPDRDQVLESLPPTPLVVVAVVAPDPVGLVAAADPTLSRKVVNPASGFTTFFLFSLASRSPPYPTVSFLSRFLLCNFPANNLTCPVVILKIIIKQKQQGLLLSIFTSFYYLIIKKEKGEENAI